MENKRQWPELVAFANELVNRIDEGNNLAARDFLRGAAVGLHDVVAGRQPDPERLVYLEFLLRTLERIVTVDPPIRPADQPFPLAFQ